jgi:hypothetical protein
MMRNVREVRRLKHELGISERLTAAVPAHASGKTAAGS